MDKFVRYFRLLLLAAMLLAAQAQPVFACPTCKNGMADNQSLVAGYQYSILFMMSMPFTILGLFAGYLYWEVRRARARQAAEAAEQGEAGASAEASETARPETVTAGR